MSNSNPPVMNKKQLLKSVLIALVIGSLVLVGAVLPAEYGMDPLGTGKLFGFSRLYVDEASESNVGTLTQTAVSFETIELTKLGSPSSIPKPVTSKDPVPAEQLVIRADTIQIKVPAGKGLEYKFKALKLGSVKYDWNTTENAIVYIDFHGEVYEENPPEEVFYESYTLAYSNNMAGTFTAPFKGKHGWYFRNKNDADVTVTLHLVGQYELLEAYK